MILEIEKPKHHKLNMKGFVEILLMWAVTTMASIGNIPLISRHFVLAQINNQSTTAWVHEISAWLTPLATIVVAVYGILKIVREKRNPQNDERIEHLIQEVEELKRENKKDE